MSGTFWFFFELLSFSFISFIICYMYWYASFISHQAESKWVWAAPLVSHRGSSCLWRMCEGQQQLPPIIKSQLISGQIRVQIHVSTPIKLTHNWIYLSADPWHNINLSINKIHEFLCTNIMCCAVVEFLSTV